MNFKNILVLISLFAAVTWAGKGIFKYNVFSTHDGNHHIARSFDAVKTFSEGHFPLRWAGSLNYGCGVPIYNFFYPLIYYLVVAFNFLTHDILFSLKLIYFLSLLLGTVFFYFWMKEETKNNLAAFGGAFLYLFAPYRFSLIFVRGSPEFLAYAILPVVLYLYTLCLNAVGKRLIFYAFLASLAGALLTISHNFTVMFLTPIILLHLLVRILIFKVNRIKVLWIFVSFVGSLLMSSFFIGPALLEKKYTKIGDNFLMWREHFPTLGQLIKSKWGYFYSSLGTHNDGMSFMLGYAQWIVLGLAAIFIIVRFFKNKSKVKDFVRINIWILFYFLLSIFTIYLILPWSIPLWEKLPPLQEIQFSWRLLGVAIFTISALFSYILASIKSRSLVVILLIGVGFLGVYGNRNHLLPQPVSTEDLYRFDDFEKLHYHRYSTTTLGDDVIYPTAPKACWFDDNIVFDVHGNPLSQKVSKGNTYGSVKFEVDRTIGDKLNFHLGYFPGIYNFELNGKKLEEYSDCDGLVCLNEKVRTGANFVSWKIIQSPTEKLFNYLTILTLVVWLALLIIFLGGFYRDKRRLILFLIFFAVSALFLFFRLYNLNLRTGFSWDQERDAFAVKDILSGKLTLLGPRVQGPTGFFLPPYFYYVLAPFYFFTVMNPAAVLYFIGFMAAVFLVGGYFLISRVFGTKVALIFLVLWGVHPLAISLDLVSWNPIVIPFLFLALISITHSFYVYPKTWKLFLAGLVLGFGISFHIQFLLVSFFLVPLVLGLVREKKFANIFQIVFGVILPFLPLLLFDLRHDFLNFKNLVNFSASGGITESRALIVWDRFAAFILNIDASNLLGIMFYLTVSFALLIVPRNIKVGAIKKIFNGFAATWVLSLPLFLLFLKNPSEYYFNYLLIPLFLLVAYLLGDKLRSAFLIIAILLILAYFLPRSISTLSSNSYYYEEKVRAVLFLKNVTSGGSPFNVSFDVPINEDSGFRYLLDYYKVSYSGNPNDPLVEFVVPPGKKPESFVFGKIGVYIPPSWIKSNWIR